MLQSPPPLETADEGPTTDGGPAEPPLIDYLSLPIPEKSRREFSFVERRAALAQQLAAGGVGAVDHATEADRYDVSHSAIANDVRLLGEVGVFEEAGGPFYRCGFCEKVFSSRKSVKKHVTSLEDDTHRGRSGSDPDAVAGFPADGD